MRILHVARVDGGIGAMRATFRLHRLMRAAGLDSRMLVAERRSGLPEIAGPETPLARAYALARPRVADLAAACDAAPGRGLRSYNLLPTGMHRRINASGADIVHLHWVGAETIGIDEIGRIAGPVVWTLRDMWPFSGALHYEDPGMPERFAQGFPPLPPDRRRGWWPDLDRWTHRRKIRAWRRLDLTAIGLSHWIADCARRSEIFRERQVVRIPNAIDLDRFRPRDPGFARDVLGLPQDHRLILFGAVDGGGDPRKGAAYLWQALRRVWERLPPMARERTSAVLFGAHEAVPEAAGLPVHAVGPVADEATLALLHAAADLFVAPSLQENLPNTVIEAAACGRPAVAFDVGGMADVIADGETGRLVPAADAPALADAIAELLSDEARRATFGRAARRRAETEFAPEAVIAAHERLYAEILGRRA